MDISNRNTLSEIEMLNENLLTSLILSINIRNWTCSIRTSFKYFFLLVLFQENIFGNKIYSRISFVCHSQYFFFILAQKFTESEIHVYLKYITSSSSILMYKNGTRLYCLRINIYFCTRCSSLFMCKGKKTNLNFHLIDKFFFFFLLKGWTESMHKMCGKGRFGFPTVYNRRCYSNIYFNWMRNWSFELVNMEDAKKGMLRYLR